MTNYFNTATCLFIFSILASGSLYAKAATHAQATQSLMGQLSGIQSMTADFSQSTKLTQANKKSPQKTNMTQHMNQSFTGTMSVARPGKFYWETLSPAKQTIVTTGQMVWIYDPDLEQAVKKNLDAQVANTPALLLSGNAQHIMQTYDISQPDSQKTYYSLKPKDKESAFEQLWLSFGQDKKPTLMILQDSMGQTTTIQFNHVQLNKKLDNKLFDFIPPKGTDIIEQ